MERNANLTTGEVRQFARRLVSDYDAHSPGSMFAEPGTGVSVDDGYRLQIEAARVRADRGETVAGFKIGCVSDAIRRQLGIDHSVFGHVFRSEILPSDAALGCDGFCNLGIEGEFALAIAEDVDDLAALHQAPERFVTCVFPVIELHNVVFRGPDPTPGELVANNALHAGIVAPFARETLKSRGSLPIRVLIDGRETAEAEVDPLATLHELASLLAEHGIRLSAGDVVLTGSPLPLFPVGPGDRIRVEWPGEAEVTASCANAGRVTPNA